MKSLVSYILRPRFHVKRRRYAPKHELAITGEEGLELERVRERCSAKGYEGRQADDSKGTELQAQLVRSGIKSRCQRVFMFWREGVVRNVSMREDCTHEVCVGLGAQIHLELSLIHI